MTDNYCPFWQQFQNSMIIKILVSIGKKNSDNHFSQASFEASIVFSCCYYLPHPFHLGHTDIHLGHALFHLYKWFRNFKLSIFISLAIARVLIHGEFSRFAASMREAWLFFLPWTINQLRNIISMRWPTANSQLRTNMYKFISVSIIIIEMIKYLIWTYATTIFKYQQGTYFSVPKEPTSATLLREHCAANKTQIWPPIWGAHRRDRRPTINTHSLAVAANSPPRAKVSLSP